MESLGKKVLRLRTERNLTQKALAAAAGIDAQIVIRLEQGTTGAAEMRMKNVQALARGLEISLATLIAGTDAELAAPGGDARREPVLVSEDEEQVDRGAAVLEAGKRLQPPATPDDIAELTKHVDKLAARNGPQQLVEDLITHMIGWRARRRTGTSSTVGEQRALEAAREQHAADLEKDKAGGLLTFPTGRKPANREPEPKPSDESSTRPVQPDLGKDKRRGAPKPSGKR